MASNLSNYARGAVLDAIFNNTALQKSARYVKLHIGDPGLDGTANAAGNTTRKSVTASASSAGVFTSTNDLAWTNVSTTETYSHISVWDDPTAGNCLWVGAMTATHAVTAGDTFTIAAASLTAAVT